MDGKSRIKNDGSKVALEGDRSSDRNLCKDSGEYTLENQIDTRNVQPSFPEKSASFGGCLGNWSGLTESDSLGNYLPHDLKLVKKNAILRIHLYQINILQHPLLISEEKQNIQLKRIYLQYKTIFEENTFSHLINRIHTSLSNYNIIRKEIDQCLSSPIEKINEEEMFFLLKRLNNNLVDVTESFSILVDLKDSVNYLSKEIIDNWAKLQESRRCQGFLSTGTRLSAHLIKREDISNREVILVDGHTNPTSLIDFTNSADEKQWSNVKEMISNLFRSYEDFLKICDSCTSDSSTTNFTNISQPNHISVVAESTYDGGSNRLQSLLSCNHEKLKSIFETVDLSENIFPDVVMRLSDDMEVSADTDVGPEERQRRKLWRQYRWRINVYIDDSLIWRSKLLTVKEFPYRIPVLESLEIRISQFPKAVRVDVDCMHSLFGINDSFNRLVSFKIPTQSDNEVGTVTHAANQITGWFTSVSESKLHFPSQRILDLFLGSKDDAEATRFEGALLCSMLLDVANVSTREQSHNIESNIDFDVSPSQIATVPPEIRTKKVISRKTCNIERIFEKFLPDNYFLDPNDPNNESLLLSKSTEGRLLERSLFGLNAVCALSENNISYDNYMRSRLCQRFILLTIRSKKLHQLKEPVPMSEESILNSLWYHEYVKNPSILDLLSVPSPHSNTLQHNSDSKRTVDLNYNGKMTNIISFFERIRNSQTLNYALNRKLVLTSSVVAEKDYFVPSSSAYDIGLPPRKRKLKPSSLQRSPEAQVTACSLLVQVVGAKNIPLRESDVPHYEGSSLRSNSVNLLKNRPYLLRTKSSVKIDDSLGNKEVLETTQDQSNEQNPLLHEDIFDGVKSTESRRAQSFVEIKFQDYTFVTSTKSGATPVWKQSFSIPIHPPDGNFTPNTLLSVRDEIVFTLFDEIVDNDLDRRGFLEDENTQRIERRYLGRLVIPFSTVYEIGRVDGVFRVDSPPFIMGSSQILPGAQVSRSTTIWRTLFECDCFGTASSRGNVIDPNDVRELRVSNPDPFPKKLNVDPMTSEFTFFVPNDQSATYLKIFMTFDPFIVSSSSQHRFGLHETSASRGLRQDRTHLSYARIWLEGLKSHGVRVQNRFFKLFAMSSHGEEVFICRYLTPQRPPKGFLSRRSCIHLISMIPCIKNSVSFNSGFDIWCTSKELWEIGAGDEEERAIQLYNYFYFLTHYYVDEVVGAKLLDDNTGGNVITKYPTPEALSKESVFLASGRGVPEGLCYYLIVRVNDQSTDRYVSSNHIVINPNNGYVCSAAETWCPLRSIHTLATPYNIWANIQEFDSPNVVSYDIQNSQHWVPFFSSRHPFPTFGLHSVQEVFTYYDTMTAYAIEIENAIKDSIKSNLRKWRSKRLRSATTFHPDACSAATEILESLEQFKRNADSNQLSRNNENSSRSDSFEPSERIENGDTTSMTVVELFQKEIKSKLRTVLRSRRLIGFPLNLPFTDVDSVSATIKSTRIYENSHHEAQFVIGVRVFPLTNNVVSVWVFVGVLETESLSLFR